MQSSVLRGIRSRLERVWSRDVSVDLKNYWTRHNVTSHYSFKTADESLDYFHWRNDQYFNYIDLMPVTGQDNNIVLDYGCGPGHDLVGFGIYSRPAKLIGMDVSPSSIEEARRRMKLHQIPCELSVLEPNIAKLPLDDMSVDYIHCSGVLHHTADPLQILHEFQELRVARLVH